MTRNYFLATAFFVPVISSAHAQTIGINTQLYMTPYADIGTVEKALSYIPQVTTLRDDLIGYNTDPSPYNTLAAKGYKFDMVVPSGNVDVTSVVSQLHNFAVANPGALASIEGSNEVDNWPVVYNGQSGLAGAAAWQQALYTAIKADPVLQNVPVINATCGECSPAQFAQLSASGAFDVNSAHVYVQGGQSAAEYIKTAIPYEVPNTGSKPIAVTETGYSGGGDLVELLRASADAGVQATYIYELLPAGPDSFELGFGIFNPDGTPKPDTIALEQTLADTPAPVSATAQISQSTAAGVPNPSPQTTTITPGGGSITDDRGHVWKITASGSITEDGQYTPGGGGTSALTIIDGVVYGQDNGHDGNTVNPGGWFTLSANGQTWDKSAPPGSAAAAASATAATPSAPLPFTVACTTAVPNAAAATGGFGTLDGQFYDPSGKPWIAQGINVPDFNMSTAQDTLLSLLPNTNFIRLNIYSYADPSSYQSFINWATSHGIVVEIDDHTSFPSDAFSGSQLNAETQFFSAMATAFKTNPYVWFETQNEPQGGDITSEEVAVYKAVRDAGNNNPIGMQLWGGGNANFLSLMNLSAYTSMTNVYITPHFYAGSRTGDAVASTLQTEIAAAQQIKTADGTPPILIDEYGDSMDGSNIDAGGPAAVAAVNQSGFGSAAWNFMNPGGSGDPADQVTNNGQSLTAMGLQIAAFQTTPNPGCAQATVPTFSSVETAPALAEGNSAQTAPALSAADTSTTAPPLLANTLSVNQVAAMAAAQ